MGLPFWLRRSFSVLTWNVWFGLEKPLARWTALLSTLGSLRPDFIALQEATTPFLELLRKAPWVRRHYQISDPRGESFTAYGNVILARSTLRSTSVQALPSEMDRQLVVVEVDVGGRPWAVATTHLDSFAESSEIRGRKMADIFTMLEPFENAVLMGDFNFCSSWSEENSRIPPEYLDSWPAVASDEGYTVDTARNELRRRHTEGEKRVRFDRILVRSSVARPVKARLVGTEKIGKSVPPLFASDHFGVLARLRLARPFG